MRRPVPSGRIGQRVLGVLAVVGTIVGIIMGLWRLSRIEAQPPPPPQVVQVFVPQWRSVTQDEQMIGAPLSDAARSLPGVTSVECRTTSNGVSMRVVAEPAKAGEPSLLERVRTAFEPARLPDDAQPPTIVSGPLAGAQTLRWVVTSGEHPFSEVRAWVDGHVRTKLERVPGVRDVGVCGPEAPVVEVRLDAARLTATKVTFDDVLQALRASGGGPGANVSPEQLQGLALRDAVRLNDVAQVALAPPPPKCTAFARGRPVMLIEASWAPTSEAPKPPLPMLGLLAPAGVVVSRLGALDAIELFVPGGAAERLAGMSQALPDGAVESRGDTATVLFPHGGFGAAVQAVPIGPGVGIRRMTGAAGSRVVLRGPSRENLSHVVEAVKRAPSLAVFAAQPPALTRKEWRFDRDALARAGVPIDHAARLIRLALTGEHAGGVVVRLAYVEDVEALATLQVAPGVPLGNLAQLVAVAEPAELLLVDGQPALEVYVMAKEPAAVTTALAAVKLPAGVTLRVEAL